MAGQDADRDASNAIVGLAGYYAGALARAHGERDELRRQVESLIKDKVQRDKELHQARVEGDNLRGHVGVAETKKTEAEKALQVEQMKTREQQREITALKDRIEQQRGENERLQRVNVESHNERDRVQKTLHASGEALGWLKSEANRFVSELKQIVTVAGYTVEDPADVLEAVRDLVKLSGKPEKKTSHPNHPALLPKG